MDNILVYIIVLGCLFLPKVSIHEKAHLKRNKEHQDSKVVLSKERGSLSESHHPDTRTQCEEDKKEGRGVCWTQEESEA